MASLVGLLVGMEDVFPQPFLDAVNHKGKELGVTAELASLAGSVENEAPRYAVLVDRISHEVPYFRGHLKGEALKGVAVINDPFWWEADEKFFENMLARRLGVGVPRTVLLPNRENIAAIDPERSLRNLQRPLDWERLIRYVGFPAVLKPNTGGGWKQVTVVRSMDELLEAYEASGLTTMILQEFIQWDDYVRCICIGRDQVLPLRYHPKGEGTPGYMPEEPVVGRLRQEAVESVSVLCHALGYDMNAIELAVRGDSLYAIDFLNPAPDFNRNSIKEDAFNWVIDRLSELCIRYALRKGAPPPWMGDHRWWRYLWRQD